MEKVALAMETVSSHDADELGQYQSLSTLAVMALLLGVLSLVAFFSSLLLVVPLFAVGVAALALASIKRADGGLQGTRLAYCGLSLAIVFGVASVSRGQVRVELLRRQANTAAERWLSLLAHGRAEEAQEMLTSKAKAKISTSEEVSALAPIFEAELSNAQILRDPLAVALIKRQQSGEETLFRSEGGLAYDLSKPHAVLYFKLSHAEPPDSLFLLSLVKTGGPHSPAVWRIDSWETEGVTKH